MTAFGAYHPLNVLKHVADNVWIADARLPSSHFELPIRMTVIRLSDGNLVLYSPTPYNQALHDNLKKLGNVRHLVAPNIAHWIYLKQWQDEVPEARTFAVEGLGSRDQVQTAGLRIDQELKDNVRPFGEDIEMVLVSVPRFQEAVLFHRPTRTIILADLVQNFEPERLSLGMKIIGSLLGVTAPNGRAPLYLRLLVRLNRSEAASAVQRIVDFGPARVIFAHGRWFETDATSQLRRSFRWLLTSPPNEEAERTVSPWVPAGLAAGGLLVGFLFWRHRRHRSQINRIAEDLLKFVRTKEWGR